MLQLEVQQNLEAERLKRSLCQVMLQVARQIPPTPTQQQILEVTPALPHLQEVAITLTQWVDDKELIWAFTGVAWFYQGQGAYGQAQPWYEQCLTAVQTRLGEEHPYVA